MCKGVQFVERGIFENKVDSLLEELREYVEQQALSEHDVYLLKAEIDKLLYECLYYKSRLIC
jgi:hypothetical protein